jgi:hypothetical protein
MKGTYKLQKVIDGKTYDAEFTVEDGMIHLASKQFEGEKKVTQLGGMADNPEVLAGMLLRELVEGK